MTPAKFNGRYVIRFCVTYEHATEKDILDAWSQIKGFAEEILRDTQLEISSAPATPETERTSSEPVAVTGKPPIKKILTRTKSLRFSFTRSISREQFQSQSEHLMDGCTPILVVDPKTIQQSFQQAAEDNQNNNITKLKDISDVDTDEASN